MTTTLGVASDRPALKERTNLLTARLRRENAKLREQLAQLAALVDHYYGAYREAQSLADRRDRQIADLRRQLHLTPTALNR